MRIRSPVAVTTVYPLVIISLLMLLVGSPLAAQQSGSISGTVVDEQGNPLVNARVLLPASGITVITDASGLFRIVGLPETGDATIRITTLGFSPVTEAVAIGATGLRFQLTRAAISLDALVVTGTAVGVQQARAVGNSVVNIRGADAVEAAYLPDVSSMINGRAPGVVVTPGTGQVGAGTTIRIRGASSFSLTTQPLIYVDGVRLDNTFGSGMPVQGWGSGVVNRLNDINPEDIESIEIIKGSAAATLYGTEASNGVIQILTKKGRPGPPEINVRIRQGANWFANAAGRIDNNWGLDPATGEPYEMDIFALEKERGNPPIFTTGHLQGYGASIRGGTSQINYFVSANYDRDGGIEPRNKLWRLSTRGNLTIAPHPKIDMTLSVGRIQGRTDLATEAGYPSRMLATVFAVPSLRDAEGYRGFYRAPPEIFDEVWAFWQDNAREQYSLELNHRPWNWLAQRLLLGQDQVRESNIFLSEQLPDSVTQYVHPFDNLKERHDRDVSTTTLDYGITATVPLSTSIRSSTTLGAQYYHRYTDLRDMIGNTFPAPGLTVVDALAQTYAGETYIENNTLGVFVQEQIAIDDRVFLTGAIRGDDNSAFGRDYDFVAYPKASATWIISAEPFWTVNFIDALKLRAAFGQSGQQPGAFDASRTYSAVTGAGGIAALTPAALGNDSLGPERGSELEVGFEVGLWQSRVGLDFTYYYSRTSDAILLRQPPPSLGFPSLQFVNVGKIRNTGLEMQLTALAVQSDNLDVDLSLNIATNANKVLELGGIDQGVGYVTAGPGNRHSVGHPVGAMFARRVVDANLVGTGLGAVATDIFCDGGDPDGILLPDGTPTEPGGSPVACDVAPWLYAGNPVPTFEGALSTTVTLFRNLKLNALIDWQTGHMRSDWNFGSRCKRNQCRENYFPEDYDPAVIAQMQSNEFAWFVYAGSSFAKIREISLSWAVPVRLATLIGAKNASITVASRNLCTITGYTGIDPEVRWVGDGPAGRWSNREQAMTPPLTSLVTTLSLSF
ncbi:TonB-dependent receptor domain-containing protein [Gemmatimonadota bacterium]